MGREMAGERGGDGWECGEPSGAVASGKSVPDHSGDAGKMVTTGSGAQHEVENLLL